MEVMSGDCSSDAPMAALIRLASEQAGTSLDAVDEMSSREGAHGGWVERIFSHILMSHSFIRIGITESLLKYIIF
jgi:hypothetical protein